MKRTIAALALGLILGSASMALAAGPDATPGEPLTHSRFVLATSTTDVGPQQVKFIGCPSNWSLPSFSFTFVGYDPTNNRLVLRCPS